MSFAAIDYIDVWPLSSSLRSKMGVFRDGIVAPVRNFERYEPYVKGWPALVATLKALRDLATAQKWELGIIDLYRLLPMDATQWREMTDTGVRAVLPIITNPGVAFFAGRLSQHIEAGVLTLVDRTLPTCVVNWGKTTHVHLEITCFPKGEPNGQSE